MPLPHSGVRSERTDAAARAVPELAQVTRRMAQGDEAAYRAFYDAYFDRLWRYLLVVAAGNEDTAREALQGTLLRVARHIKVFHDETVFWSWLTVLARSAFKDETRQRRRYFSFLDRFSLHSQTALEEPGVADADGQLAALLSSQVQLLSGEDRKLIEQKYFAHRSVRELAAELQATEKAVESRLSRIRRKLKTAVLTKLNNESRS